MRDLKKILIFLKNSLEKIRSSFFLFKDYLCIYLFLERGEGKEKEEQKYQCVVASRIPPTGDLAHNPGMNPDWESNQLPCGLQAGAQSTEPHQTGRKGLF